jgi:hypothetical protein
VNTNVNAKPCHLNGHDWTLWTDGSLSCAVCQTYRGPNHDMVNALLRAAAGGRVYRKQACALHMTGFNTPTAPKPIPPPVPAFKDADGSTKLPSLYLLLPIMAAVGVALGLGIWAIWNGGRL